jgi:hypothetical protein
MMGALTGSLGAISGSLSGGGRGRPFQGGPKLRDVGGGVAGMPQKMPALGGVTPGQGSLPAGAGGGPPTAVSTTPGAPGAMAAPGVAGGVAGGLANLFTRTGVTPRGPWGALMKGAGAVGGVGGALGGAQPIPGVGAWPPQPQPRPGVSRWRPFSRLTAQGALGGGRAMPQIQQQLDQLFGPVARRPGTPWTQPPPTNEL